MLRLNNYVLGKGCQEKLRWEEIKEYPQRIRLGVTFQRIVCLGLYLETEV